MVRLISGLELGHREEKMNQALTLCTHQRLLLASRR